MITAQSKQEAFNIAVTSVLERNPFSMAVIHHEDQIFLSQLHHALSFAVSLFGKSEAGLRQWKVRMLYIAKHYELDDSIIKASM